MHGEVKINYILDLLGKERMSVKEFSWFVTQSVIDKSSEVVEWHLWSEKKITKRNPKKLFFLNYFLPQKISLA